MLCVAAVVDRVRERQGAVTALPCGRVVSCLSDGAAVALCHPVRRQQACVALRPRVCVAWCLVVW